MNYASFLENHAVFVVSLREPILIRPDFAILLAWTATWPLSARNGLRFMRQLLLVILVLLFAHDFVIGRAAAIEVQCIEASKYKYLYQIFGGDSKKFAAYLQLDGGKLPNPEHCRTASSRRATRTCCRSSATTPTCSSPISGWNAGGCPTWNPAGR